MFSKCQNPECNAEFDPYRGGQFFCFRQEDIDSVQANAHHVKHYWLCEVCSVRYVLVQEPSTGVILRTIVAEAREPLGSPKRKSSEAA